MIPPSDSSQHQHQVSPGCHVASGPRCVSGDLVGFPAGRGRCLRRSLLADASRPLARLDARSQPRGARSRGRTRSPCLLAEDARLSVRRGMTNSSRRLRPSQGHGDDRGGRGKRPLAHGHAGVSRRRCWLVSVGLTAERRSVICR